MIRYFILFSLLSISITNVQSDDYWSARQNFVENEESLSLGSSIKLTINEERVNEILMKAKHEEMNNGFLHPEEFPPALHFFKALRKIKASKVFSIIHKMPKGGGLHLHDTVIASSDYVISNITYRDHLYACIENDDLKMLKFSPFLIEGTCWISMKSLREQNKDLDIWLKSKLSMFVADPNIAYPDINAAWKKFQSIFDIITPMLTYKPVWSDYFYQGLQEMYDDNVNYVEIRGTLPEVYDFEGTIYNSIEVLGILNETATRFLLDHPNFLGIKYIYGPGRHVDETQVKNYLTLFNQMKENYPDFLVGFDLVNQEDKGYPLTEFISELTSDAAENIKFFFHAGETNWNGMSTDLNLIDAVLLNTTRIGHGYAVVNHPKVLQEIKRRGIGIEVNPISNQVLMLVKDLRNHPAGFLIANDFPLVISSDAPSFWEVKGLSYDFYEAFIGLASANADLKFLKQLAINSFLYSGLEPIEKGKKLEQFHIIWDKFINDF